ncbi:MAG: GNAT family N-acetyltransferase [Clostridia bacterium]|nr:GNAT family N-acetyltransferase [Clostridia bacterium]
MKTKYINRKPEANEYNRLTDSVGWEIRDEKIIKQALENTLYSLCVYDGDRLIGYGRIIGDKTIFLYIQDIMVIPEYQGKKIGTGIMTELLKQVEEYKKINPNIRTYLGASKGKENFYKKFGFISRPNEIYPSWLAMKASEYKEYKNIRKESLRDNMTDVEVALTDLGEIATRELAKKHRPHGLKANRKIAREGGEVAKTVHNELFLG